jgi:O-antigen/teichoic acid export membrane protein
MSLFSALFYKIDIVILSWFKGGVDVGIYGAAQKIVELAMMMQSLFMASLFPLLVGKYKDNHSEFLTIVERTIVISAAIGVPICVFGLFLDNQIIGVIGGRQFVTEATVYYHGYPITTPVALAILLIFVMISYFSSPYTTSVLASGKVGQLVKVNALATVFNIGLNIWLIPRYSYLAASITTLITEILVLTLNGVYFCYRYSFRPPLGDILKIFLATVPGVIFLIYTEPVSVILRAPLVLAIYIGTLALVMPKLRQAVATLLIKTQPA